MGAELCSYHLVASVHSRWSAKAGTQHGAGWW